MSRTSDTSGQSHSSTSLAPSIRRPPGSSRPSVSTEDQVVAMLSEYRSSLPSARDAWPRDICKIMRYLKENLYDSRIMVRDVVEDCSLTRPNASGRFSAYVGTGIKGWLVDQRVGAGKCLLQFKSLTIIAVALRVGFPSHSAFTKAFKSRTSDAPSRWRKKLQAKTQGVGKGRGSRVRYPDGAV